MAVSIRFSRSRRAWFLLAALMIAVSCVSAPAETSANQLLAAGRVDDAFRLLDEQINRSPQDAAAQNQLCRAYYMLEEWDPGITACVRARDLDLQNSMYQLWLGRVYGEKASHAGFLFGAGLAKKVRTAFERAVELDPKSWEARTDLAEFYFEAPAIVGGGKDKALAQADALMSLNPGLAHWVLARLAEKERDTEAAEREYRAAIPASHSGIRAWLDLASFLRRNNRPDEMEQALHNLESSPIDHPAALVDGANMLLRTGRNLPLAIRLVHRYFSNGPVEEAPAFKVHDLLGQLLEKQGDGKTAAGEFRAALALAHGYVRAQEHLQRVER